MKFVYLKVGLLPYKETPSQEGWVSQAYCCRCNKFSMQIFFLKKT